MQPCTTRILLAIVVVAALPSSAFATLVVFPNFNTTSGLTLVGSANNTNPAGQLQLTPASSGQAGAAYSTVPVTLGASATFSTTFQFQLTSAGGIAPADGITFVLAANPSGLGSGGGGIGYGGVPNSVAIEFDTFNNGSGDGSSSNHVSINTLGALNDLALSNVYGMATCDFGATTLYTRAGCLSNGHIWTALITYNGSLINVSVTDPLIGAPFAAITNYSINIGSLLGTNTAFVGFTAGTGSGFERQNIVNWTFADTAALPPPNGVPEPGILGLSGLGLAMLAWSRRRQSKVGTQKE